MKSFPKIIIPIFLLFLIAIPVTGCLAQSQTSSKDPVEALLKKMTLNEKLTLIEGEMDPSSNRQYQAGYLPGIPRLGIPPGGVRSTRLVKIRYLQD